MFLGDILCLGDILFFLGDQKENCVVTLKTLFAPAFPCLTGLLRAPRWERLARVLLVSQRWLAVDVLLDVFSLL